MSYAAKICLRLMVRHFAQQLVLRGLVLIGLLCGTLTLVSPSARAQIGYSAKYRPQMDYQYVDTGHFGVVYPAGADTTTALFWNSLQRSFEGTRQIVGTNTQNFQLPVIVDPTSDLANGLVTPRNFRSVLYTAHPTHAFGANFNSWAQTVVPHELTHALHNEIVSGVGVGGLLGLFSEDASRIVHSLSPNGWAEGIAVYRESQIRADAGRLNAPLQVMKYRASLTSEDPWSVGEVMYSGLYERPLRRHYLGGGQLIEHMAHKRGSTDFFQRTARWHHRLPFLGFGMALWMGTGQTPAQISDEFLTAERRKERKRLDSLRRESDKGFTEPRVLAGTDGLHVRRPYWTSDSTLVAYTSGYATRPGFYRFDVSAGERTAISHQSISRGFTYTLGPDTTTLHFSRPHFDPIVGRKTTLKAHRLDLRTGHTSLVSEAGGVFSSAQGPGGTVWAARRDGSFSDLVTLSGGSAATEAGRWGFQYKQVAPSPTGETVAVLANTGGEQGLYRYDLDASTLKPWFRFEDGTIYDVSWGPAGRYLLFSADPSGIANVYVLDTRNGDDQPASVHRLTTVRYGVLEPTLSPDREQVAFTRYRHERFELATIPFRPDSGQAAAKIERSWTLRDGRTATANARTVSSGKDGTTPVSASLPGPLAAQLRDQSRPYQAWRHLFPRSISPALPSGATDVNASVGGEDLGTGIGLRLAGVDPLRRWAYNVTGFYQADRLWGTATVETGLLPFTPSITGFNRPFETVTQASEGASRLAAYEEQGVGLSVRHTFPLEKNVFTTSIEAGIRTQFRQTRPITASSEPEGTFANRLTIRPSLTAKYRVQENIRDLVPNTGLVASTQLEADVATLTGIAPSQALSHQMDVYWPLLASVNGGVRTSAAFLTQNQGALFDTESFLPRGYEDVVAARPTSGNYLRVGAKLVQPLWFVDTGSVMLPMAIDVLYGYGLGQAQYRVEEASGPALGGRRASISAGLGIQIRPFSLLNIRLEVGASYRLDPGPNASRWTSHVAAPIVP